jgi:hypothetical protein
VLSVTPSPTAPAAAAMDKRFSAALALAIKTASNAKKTTGLHSHRKKNLELLVARAR